MITLDINSHAEKTIYWCRRGLALSEGNDGSDVRIDIERDHLSFMLPDEFEPGLHLHCNEMRAAMPLQRLLHKLLSHLHLLGQRYIFAIAQGASDTADCGLSDVASGVLFKKKVEVRPALDRAEKPKQEV
ncbi:hypothetical protein ES703_66098 [subsurface metagenome]